MITKNAVKLNGSLYQKKREEIDRDLSFDAINAKKKYRRRELLCIWSVLIIPLIDLCIFWVYGTLQSIPIAFETYDAYGNLSGYGFDNFAFLFQQFSHIGDSSSILPEALRNTVLYWLLGALILNPISFIFGYFLYKKIWGYRAFRYIFFFPSLISSVVFSIFFKTLVGPSGQMQYLIKLLTGQDGVLLLFDSRTALITMLCYSAYTGLTGNLIYWLSAFARIPEEIVEAGKLDGLNTIQEFFHITFPLTAPFLATMYMLMFTGILSAGGATLLLTQGAYGTYDIGYYEYTLTVGGSKSAQAIGGCLGLIKGAIILPFTLLINRLIRKIPDVQY